MSDVVLVLRMMCNLWCVGSAWSIHIPVVCSRLQLISVIFFLLQIVNLHSPSVATAVAFMIQLFQKKILDYRLRWSVTDSFHGRFLFNLCLDRTIFRFHIANQFIFLSCVDLIDNSRLCLIPLMQIVCGKRGSFFWGIIV